MVKFAAFFGFSILAVVSAENLLSADDVSLKFKPNSTRPIKAGTDFEAYCNVPSDFSTFTGKWTFNGQDKNDSSHTITVPGLSVVIFWLSLKPVRFEDNGRYSCKITQGNKEPVVKSFQLQVFEGVNMSHVNLEQQADVGAVEANIVCAVNDSSVIWKFPNHTEITTGEKFSVASNTLTIKSISKSDAGKYVCEATKAIPGAGEHGSTFFDMENKTIEFAVNYPPVFAVNHLEVKRDDQFMVNLHCDADAKPMPTDYTWYRNETAVKDMDSCHGSVCMLKFTSDLTFDLFKCVVVNRLGNASKSFHIEGVNGSGHHHTSILPLPQVTDSTPPIGAACAFSPMPVMIIFAIALGLQL